jgi:hypothetical protein
MPNVGGSKQIHNITFFEEGSNKKGEELHNDNFKIIVANPTLEKLLKMNLVAFSHFWS